MSSDRNKELFLKQVQQILDGIKQDRDTLGQRCSDERKERDRLNSAYLELIEKQRSYYKAVKDFQEVNTWHGEIINGMMQECRKNEILLSKLKAKNG